MIRATFVEHSQNGTRGRLSALIIPCFLAFILFCSNVLTVLRLILLLSDSSASAPSLATTAASETEVDGLPVATIVGVLIAITAGAAIVLLVFVRSLHNSRIRELQVANAVGADAFAPFGSVQERVGQGANEGS